MSIFKVINQAISNYRLGNIKIKIQNKLYKFVISGQYIIKAIDIRNFVGYLGAVHMSRASPANRADLSHENLYFST